MRPSKYLTIALSLAALLVLLVAGCGGGGGGETTATTEPTSEEVTKLTKAELISQGDAVCAEVNAAVGSVGASAADTQSQIEQTATLYTSMVSNLNELGTPQEGAPEYMEFSAAGEELAKVEGEVKLAAEREDTAAIGKAAEAAAPALEDFQSTAAAFGFEDCSQGPSTPASAPTTGSGETEEGGVEAAPEIEEAAPEEVAPEEIAPEAETGGAGGGIEEVAPEEAAPEESGGGGVGPG
jgi:hypothetical protein